MIKMKKILKHLFKGDLFNMYKRKRYIKINLNNQKISDEDYLIGYGKLTLKYKMDLNNPKTFNEKLNYYKIHYDNPLMHEVVDKIKAKEYVISKGLGDIVIKTISTFDNINEFNLNSMPEQFVVKNTLDSGGVFVCKDKSKVKNDDIIKKLKLIDNEIFNGKHWALEKAYVGNNNQNRIIVEEILPTIDGHTPCDYKFFCFNGEPKFLYVTSNRDIKTCLDFFDIDFTHMECKHVYPNSKVELKKPENYEKMLEICRILSKDFPHVRVDLYNIDGKIYFGELTFFTSAGFGRYKPEKWDRILGDMWDLSKIDNYR